MLSSICNAVLRQNPQLLSVEESLRIGKVCGSLGGEELEILRLTGQARQQGRRQARLSSQTPLGQQESRGCGGEGFELLAGGDGSLAGPAVVAAAAVAARRLLRLGGFLSVGGLARLHSRGGAERFRGHLGLQHSLGELDQSKQT